MKTEYLLDREMELVLSALMPENRLIMRLCMHTGLRVGDALCITTQQLEHRRFSVLEHKTGKRKTITLPDTLLCDLREQGKGSVYVFPHRSKPDQHRTRQAVWADVKRATKAFRLCVNAGTHSARKAFAVDLMKKYGDIERVKDALNHSSIEVTLLYAMADALRNERHKVPRKRRSTRGKSGA